jgi:hypothetical protein
MHEHFWNCLKLVDNELNRLQAFKADCARRGQSGTDIQGQIDELLVRREHLQRALCTTLTSKVMA